jgi:4-amino-4-deoxy-L-arabinose transferase-like glycosyltransferase
MRDRLHRLIGWVWTARARWMCALPIAFACGYAMVLTIAANLFFMRPRGAMLHKWDEGYALAFARRMLEGHCLPYVDAVSHRGPVFYWIVAAAVKISGYGTWTPMRALTLIAMLLTMGFGLAASCFGGRGMAGAIFCLIYVGACATGMNLGDGLAFGSEHVVNVFGMLALLCLTVALRDQARRPNLALVALAGAALMIGSLGKQIGVAALAPSGLWVLAVAVERRELSRVFRWGLVAAFALGVFAPLGMVLARYAVAHELSTFYYYTVTYNLSVYGAAVRGSARSRSLQAAFLDHFDLLLVGAPLLGWGLSLLFAQAGRPRDWARAYLEQGFDATVVTNATAFLLVANGSLRNFGHYYLVVLPWAALLTGILIDRVMTRVPFQASRFPLRSLLARSAVLLPLIAVVQIGWWYKRAEIVANSGMKALFNTQDWPICRFLDVRTKPTDSIFIWGFDPAPYTACNRRPASRYVFTTFVAGYVPWVDDARTVEDARVAPGSREILLAELEHEMPAVIFDSAASMGNRSLMSYEFLRTFVVANYCWDPVNVGGPAVWTRKPTEGCDAASRVR